MAKAKGPSRGKSKPEAGALGVEAPRPSPTVVRPVSLDSIVGHSKPIEILRAAVGSGHVHHAWIFHGVKGVGKFTAAMAFAAELLTPRSDPHSAVAMLRAGTHPDLHVVRKELVKISREGKIRDNKQITIAKEVVDEFLLEPAALSRNIRSDSTAGKVFIVDEAELLDRWASHAPVQASMLKMLEEPPPGTVFILVTSDENRLLPTIRSRCQRVAFKPLEETEVLRVLRSVGRALMGAEGEWVLPFAAGSPGVALEALEAGLFAWHTALEPQLAQLDKQPGSAHLIGAIMASLVDERAAAAIKGRPEASKEAANRAWCRQMLWFVASRYGGRLAASVGQESGGSGAALAAICMIDLCRRAEVELENNVSLNFVLENLGAQMNTAQNPAMTMAG